MSTKAEDPELLSAEEDNVFDEEYDEEDDELDMEGYRITNQLNKPNTLTYDVAQLFGACHSPVEILPWFSQSCRYD